MIIETSRFGKLEINEQEIIKFSEGILGFEDQKSFCIVDPDDQTLILWLQSTNNPTVAFPIIEPRIFSPDYKPTLLPTDLKNLGLESQKDSIVYCILTIPSDITQMSANLKAPVVINSNTNGARQIVLQDNKLDVKHVIYKELKAAISHARVSDDAIRSSFETSKATETNQESKTSVKKVRVNRQQTL